MNRTDTITWLQSECAAASEPSISDGDLGKLLDEVAPGATDYDERSRYRAASRGWRRKASLAANSYGPQSAVFEHCVSQAKVYEGKSQGGGAVVSSPDTPAVMSLL
jgi:hypothetical protein